MSFGDTVDFYEYFDKYPVEFAKASTYKEFCEMVNTPLSGYLTKYTWAPACFDTAKAGKRTYRSLRFPTAESFGELFTAARYLPASNDKNDETRKAEAIGFKWMSGYKGEVALGHVGGQRGWSKTDPTTRSHYGAKFYGTYVLANEAVIATPQTLVETSAAFEAIRREDGILILGHDGLCIGSQWLALLPLTATIDSLYDEASRELIAREKAAELEAWGEVEA